jgi:site-specific recombinase XerD
VVRDAGRSLQALKELLGHADLKMTLRYAHLAPRYLRDEIAKTERPAQASAQEPAELENLSRK